MLPDLSQGLWALPPEERSQIFSYLRKKAGLSEHEPIIPVPLELQDAVAKTLASTMIAEMKRDPLREILVSDEAEFAEAVKVYFQVPTDDFLNIMEAYGEAFARSGVPPLAMNTSTTPAAYEGLVKGLRQNLSPAAFAAIEDRLLVGVNFINSLFIEGYIASYNQKAQVAAKEEAALEEFLHITGMSRELYNNMLAAYRRDRSITRH